MEDICQLSHLEVEAKSGDNVCSPVPTTQKETFASLSVSFWAKGFAAINNKCPSYLPFYSFISHRMYTLDLPTSNQVSLLERNVIESLDGK